MTSAPGLKKHQKPNKTDSAGKTRGGLSSNHPLTGPLLIAGYVCLVLLVDFLAACQVTRPWDWSRFSWSLADLLVRFPLLSKKVSFLALADHFDLFKFIFWLLLPFLFSYSTLDKSWLLPRKFQKEEWYFIGFLLLAGMIALTALLWAPSLKGYYGQREPTGAAIKLQRTWRFFIWESSWLPGWEFLCRYVFLRALLEFKPRYLWLLLPLMEGLYHLQKPFIEALGMTVFSLFLTTWTVKRKNLFLPFCAHLFVELLLLAVLLI